MDTLKIALISPDLEKLTQDTVKDYLSLHSDCDVVVFPEYLQELKQMTLPLTKDQFVIFGSRIEDGKNILLINNDGKMLKLSKQKMTPFEIHMKAGKESGIYDFKGVKIGVMICFDSEFPELVSKFKGVDVLLVPSATETVLGYERVNRCSSARSVELGCAVATCHLIGETENEMVDVNVGENNLYLPSQSLFLHKTRSEIHPHIKKGPVVRVYEIPLKEIREQRKLVEETNPALVD